jgi:proteasome assembly chaperone (PAC2) family protein
MKYVRYHNETTFPTLRDPILIAALGGWNDAADAATTGIKYLIDLWKPALAATIDVEDFLVYTEARPTIKMTKGLQRSITWPTNQFFVYQPVHLNHDILLCLGVEPQLKWKTFSKTFLEICRHFHITEAVLLGALLADVPHSIAVPMSGTATDENLQERLKDMEVHGSRYEGPTGMIGVLQDAFKRTAIPATSLWAAAPHYLAATPNIKVTSALLTYLNTYLSLGLDLSDIQSDALRFEEQITALVARDPEASAYVRRLEEQASGFGHSDDDDAEDDEDNDEDDDFFNPDRARSTGPLPSAESLIRGVEELLRKQRENGKHISDDDTDEDNL